MKTAFARRQAEGHHPLAEALAVALIVGLLASIAIPLFLDQRKKGHDAEAKAAVTTVSTAIDAYVTENETLPSVTVADGVVWVDGTSVATLAEGVVFGDLVGTDADNWCIDATHPHGDRAKVKGYKYDPVDDKVEEGRCA